MVGRAVALAAGGRMTGRLLGAAAMVVAATFLVLVARDAWHWSRAVRDGDARAALGSASAATWQADATVPAGLARRLLGLDDDLAFRRTAIRALRTSPRTPSPEAQKGRSIVETALGRIARNDPDPVRASWAADELGILMYTDPPSPDQAANAYEDPTQAGPSSQLTPEQKAEAQFESAVRLDPGNDNAQRNLELMLRQPKPPPHQGSPQPGGGDRFGHKGSGARPAGNGY
jgi:hypothetical protein